MNNVQYFQFEDLCKNGSYADIEKFIIDFSVDISFDDNIFIIMLVKRGCIDLLKLIEKYGGDLHCDDEYVMRILALYGHIECLEYIIKKCKYGEWKVLLNTNAYDNNPDTKKFIDELVNCENKYDGGKQFCDNGVMIKKYTNGLIKNI